MADTWRGKQELRERTKRYASAAIRVYCQLPKPRVECQILGRQLLRSGTSVAANYREASRARSDAEFVSKIDQCSQEADETMLWLELLRDECGIKMEQVPTLIAESDELIAIFTTMAKKVKARMSS